MPKRVIEYSRKQPARAMIIAISGITVLAGLFMLTPWYGPLEPVTFYNGAVVSLGLYITAAMNILLPLPSLYGVWKSCHRWTAYGSLAMFNWYLFIGLSRALTFPYPGRLLWLPSIMIALVMGILYLEQKDLLTKKVVVASVKDVGAGDLD